MTQSLSTGVKTWVAYIRENLDDTTETKVYLTEKEMLPMKAAIAIKGPVFVNRQNYNWNQVKLRKLAESDIKRMAGERTKIYYRDRYCGIHEWNGWMIGVWQMDVVRVSDDKIIDSYYFYYEQEEVKCIRNGKNITEMRNNGNKITMRGFKPKCQ